MSPKTIWKQFWMDLERWIQKLLDASSSSNNLYKTKVHLVGTYNKAFIDKLLP